MALGGIGVTAFGYVLVLAKKRVGPGGAVTVNTPIFGVLVGGFEDPGG